MYSNVISFVLIMAMLDGSLRELRLANNHMSELESWSISPSQALSTDLADSLTTETLWAGSTGLNCSRILEFQKMYEKINIFNLLSFKEFVTHQ